MSNNLVLNGEKLNNDLVSFFAAVANREKSSLITISRDDAKSAPKYIVLGLLGENAPIRDSESSVGPM